jgi:hypothetical protein
MDRQTTNWEKCFSSQHISDSGLVCKVFLKLRDIIYPYDEIFIDKTNEVLDHEETCRNYMYITK